MNLFLILIGKFISGISRLANIGNGSTWPGHIALSLNPNFIKDMLKNSQIRIILIAGTNGKTTTAKLIRTIFEKSGKKVFQNQAGANLLNGIASSIVLHSDILCALNYDVAIFEIDENTLPLILKEINNPDFIIILNLFRDQLDRYGEVNTIAKKWGDAIRHLPPKTTLILNADDPQIAFLGLSRCVASNPHPMWKENALFFGLGDKKTKSSIHQHAADSTYCPNCGEKLNYNSIYYSHLGNWFCKKCCFKHPQKTFTSSPFYPLSGIYNQYNTNTAVLLAKLNNVNSRTIEQSLKDFKPAFGRQETLNIDGKKVQIFLSKNPTSFNESLKTIVNLNARNLLIALNDRIPDGRDVSWIWDADTEEYIKDFNSIIISGDRAYDMGLRIKYSQENQNSKFKIIENLRTAIEESLKLIHANATLYILPTYSAMLEVRKILTGKKIL